MTERDATLDAFTGQDARDDEADSADDDTGGESDGDAGADAADADAAGADGDVDAAGGERDDPAATTFAWSPAGARCAECDETARRRWRVPGDDADERWVCGDCVAWERDA